MKRLRSPKARSGWRTWSTGSPPACSFRGLGPVPGRASDPDVSANCGRVVVLATAVVADVVVVEVAGQLGHALLFDDALEPAPRGIAELLAPALGQVQFLVDLIEVDIRAIADGRVVFLFFEL